MSMHNRRSYTNLNSDEKDEVIGLLLTHLDLELYDPYQCGPTGVALRSTKEETTPEENRVEE